MYTFLLFPSALFFLVLVLWGFVTFFHQLVWKWITRQMEFFHLPTSVQFSNALFACLSPSLLFSFSLLYFCFFVLFFMVLLMFFFCYHLSLPLILNEVFLFLPPSMPHLFCCIKCQNFCCVLGS